MAQSVEHVIGNDEVIGSIPITSSKKAVLKRQLFYFFIGKSSFFVATRQTKNKVIDITAYSGVKNELNEGIATALGEKSVARANASAAKAHIKP